MNTLEGESLRLGVWEGSVHGPSALRGPALADDLAFLKGELVVVGDLLACFDVSAREDDHLLHLFHHNAPGKTVWLKRKRKNISPNQFSAKGGEGVERERALQSRSG